MNIDTLITRFLLDPKGYKDGGDQVIGMTSKISGSIERLQSGLMSGIGKLLNPTAWVGGIGVIAAGIGLLGHEAVGAAIGFDTISRSLAAVTKDAQRAKAILKFDDQLAGPSIFTSEDLAQASLTLEAFKLQTERFLPVAEKLGTVFGSTKESLNEFVTALGYIKNGRFGEGFESLTRAGLSREDFVGQGLKFDKGGSFVGSADEALTAIEKLVNERFGKLSQEMASGPAAKLASVMDAIGRAARIAGYAILSVLMPAAEKMGAFIAWLVDGGYIERAAKGIARLFNGEGIGDFAIRGIAFMVATLQHVPGLVKAIGFAFMGLFTWLRDNLMTIGRIFVAIWAFQAVYNGMMMIFKAIKAIQAAEEGLGIVAAVTQAIMTDGASVILTAATAALGATAAVAAFDAIMSRVGDLGSMPGMAGISGVVDAISRDANNMVKAYEAPKGQGPTGAAGSILDTLTKTLASPTQQIADNTRKTAEHTAKMASIQDQVLGGGTVGQGAASAVNVSKALHGANGSGGDKLDRAVRLIRDHVMEVSGGMIVEDGYRRRGGR